MNTDQCGVKMELVSGRSLSFMGEDRVKASIQRQNAITHSFTTQMTIHADGKLDPMILVVFYIPGGTPQIFNQEMRQFNNIYAKATTSGLCNSGIMLDYFADVIAPSNLNESI